MRKKQPTIEYNSVNDPKHMHGYKGVRFVENVSRGLRRIGFADEVLKGEGYPRMGHRGWYTDDEGMSGEVYRGVVYQLPARHGLTQYVIGYDDPCNPDCALLSFFAPIEHKQDAARAADRFAEIFAEAERDYNRAWQAGRRYEDLDEEIKAMRTEALEIGAEMRAAKNAPIVAPRICATLRDKIVSLYRAIQKARKERAELADRFDTAPGFKE